MFTWTSSLGIATQLVDSPFLSLIIICTTFVYCFFLINNYWYWQALLSDGMMSLTDIAFWSGAVLSKLGCNFFHLCRLVLILFVVVLMVGARPFSITTLRSNRSSTLTTFVCSGYFRNTMTGCWLGCYRGSRLRSPLLTGDWNLSLLFSFPTPSLSHSMSCFF